MSRYQLDLADNWWVSVAPRDAVLAATQPRWRPADLERAAEPDNHPQPIRLGTDVDGLYPRYGKRPDPRGGAGRVPAPFLSYARHVVIPRAWAGHTVFLHLDNVRYHVAVAINDRPVTQYTGGLEPHRRDVTKYVTPGQPALVLITVGDSGTSGHRPFDPYHFTGTRLPTCQEIANNLIHPVIYGGSDRAVGSVRLEAVPPVRVEYVFADPKVSRGVLRYTVALRNDTAKVATVRVQSAAVSLEGERSREPLRRRNGSRGRSPSKQRKGLLDELVTLPARHTKLLRRTIPWPDALRWDTDHPHLYELQTTLTTPTPDPSEEGNRLPSSGGDGGGSGVPRGQVFDTHRDSFGFREFTINGHSFYLNGRKIHLHGQSGHTSPEHDWMTLAQKIAYLRAWKEQGHVTHFRLHARPQHKEWVLAADRVGMLLTTETALWTTGFHSFDWVGSAAACYQNVRQHFLEAVVRRDRNNPSVVIWSLSNEMSPITPFDLDQPKMAAMTRVFERILAETKAEDASRVIQMSSAMDFLGRLAMYNLHYPKSWQGFPDYPHTAYWLDGSFLFPWYGARRHELPAWSWRRDKPLYFGEFTCVYGATPDSQASIVGDAAFAEPDFGTALVNAKLWPMEIKAYRRRDVSGFCAWAAGFPERKQMRAFLRRPEIVAHTASLKPVAVLSHTYRQSWLGGDEVAFELSIHNDSRQERSLEFEATIFQGRQRLWTESMPAAQYGPAELRAVTTRWRAPLVTAPAALTLRVRLRAEGRVADQWEQPFTVHPRAAAVELPVDFAVYDPDGAIAERLRARGVAGGQFVRHLADLAGRTGLRAVWLHFDLGKIHLGEWRAARSWLDSFVQAGGLVVLDHAPAAALADLPVTVEAGAGNAPGGRLELTCAYNHAPHHPVMRRFRDADFALWGADHYVARRTYALPQEGNVIPWLLAGTASSGLTQSPLLEVQHGAGSCLVTALECLEKLEQDPRALAVLLAVANYQPGRALRSVGLAVAPDTERVLREVGLAAPVTECRSALEHDVSLIDGDRMPADAAAGVRAALAAGGRTVVLHALTVEQTRALLAALELPGAVRSGVAADGEYDVLRHTHALTTGMSNNQLYWIVNKTKLALWTRAALHPQPATALIALPRGAGGWSLTKRGAVTVYPVGPGQLVIDNLRWQLSDFDEPERPRRYVARLLTNLGVPLERGAAKRLSADYETEAERRERGHF